MRYSKQDTAAFLALLAFVIAAFLPIWRIEIWAPQYPEGLVMQIGTYWMAGDIQQINILNHYIGMQPIEPHNIIELRIVPWFFVFLTVFGVYALVKRKASWFRIWLFMVIASGALGILDLYRWGYNYGHNLSATAPIKIPGMNYQPPLIGDKILLNIHSYSLPDIGSYLLFFSLFIGILGVLWRSSKEH
jgi:copper chaperone NosL